MASHIVKSYDEQLRKLNDTLVRMGGVVESQISAAMQALTRRDPDLALCHLRMEPNKPRLASASQLRAVCRRIVAQCGLLGVTASVSK